MPRPQPLFIPGPTGMGGRHTATQVDLNLGTIAQLYDKLIAQPQRDQAAAQAILEGAPEIAKMFGIGAASSPEDRATARTAELPTGGAINLPPSGRAMEQAMEQQATRQQGIGKIAGSSMARTILQDLMKERGGAQKTAHYTIREKENKANVKSIDLVSGQSIPEGWEIISAQGEGVPSYFPLPYLGPSGEPLFGERRKGEIISPTGAPKGPFQPAQEKLMPDDRASGFGDARTLISNMKDISDTWDQTLTGPAEGNINKAKSLVMNNPEFESLRAKLGQLRTIIYNISGKQINEAELKWLDNEILPRLTNPDKNFKAKLNELNDWILKKAKNSAVALKASQFHVPSEFMSNEFYYGERKTSADGKSTSPGKAKLYDKYGLTPPGR